jgi:hypothetical protein
MEMSTLTIDLPKALAEAIQNQNVSLEEIQTVIVKALEDWLQSRAGPEGENGQDARRSRFGTSAAPFAEKLIEENRALFERLAQL